MSDQMETGVEFTPEETAFFDNRGQAPEPEPEKVETQKTETVEAEKPEPKVEKVVPLPALHEERNKRKAIEARLREIELENARYAERFKIIEKVDKQPTPAEDPFAYLEKVVPGEIDEVRKKLAEFEKRDQEQTQHRQVLSSYASDVQRFKAETPDFDDAYKFVVNGYFAEAQAMGLPNPVEAAQAHELQIVMNALQRGVSPAEALFSVAKARGFQSKPKEDEKKPAAEKLDTIEKGQAANKSLSQAGGQPGGEEMTAEQLLKMPLDEFEAWTKKNPAKARRLMGG
jgi:hypothetical protein